MTFLGAHTLFSFNYKHLFFLFKVYYSLEYICRLICKFCFFVWGRRGGDFVPPPFGGATDRPAVVVVAPPPPYPKKRKRNWGKKGGEKGGEGKKGGRRGRVDDFYFYFDFGVTFILQQVWTDCNVFRLVVTCPNGF